MKYLSVVLLFSVLFNGFAEAQRLSLVPQMTGSSCWAACVEMATDGRTKQASHFPTKCGTLCQDIEDALLYGSCDILSTVHLENMPGKLGDNFAVLNDKMAYAKLSNAAGRKPSVLYHQFGGRETNNHMVVLFGTASQRVGSQSAKWVRVYDPFPICSGSEYFISYEQYKVVNGSTIAWENTNNHRGLQRTTSDDGYMTGLRASTTRISTTSDELVRSYLSSAQKGTSAFRGLVGTTSARSVIVGQPAIVSYVDSRFMVGPRSSAEELMSILQSEDTRMYNIRNATSYTTLYTARKGDSEFKRKWFLSRIENGSRYRPFFEPLIVSPIAGNPSGHERVLIDLIRKVKAPFLVLRFTDLDLEFIFRESRGSLIVFDPYHNFSNLVGKNDLQYLPFSKFNQLLTAYSDRALESIEKRKH